LRASRSTLPLSSALSALGVIENEFLASKELLDSIREVSHDKSMEKLFKKEHISEYIESYVNKTPQEIISTIVKKRGFLHHHNPKHPETWNPDGQERFRVDAIFLMHICHKIVFKMFSSYVYDERVMKISPNDHAECMADVNAINTMAGEHSNKSLKARA
jgi:hypothetical protein